MIDTPASAAAEVQRRGLPPVFSAVWDDALPPVLKPDWQRPHTYFEVCRALVEYVPGLTGLCPLWEHNGEAIVGCLPDERYIRFYYEDAGLQNPEAAIAVLGTNYQQFVTLILAELVEAGLWDEFDTVARLLEYKYTRDLRAVLESYTDEHGETDLERFRASVA